MVRKLIYLLAFLSGATVQWFHGGEVMDIIGAGTVTAFLVVMVETWVLRRKEYIELPENASVAAVGERGRFHREKITDFADARAQEVRDGRETERFAALLVQKYGKGFVDMALVVDDKDLADNLQQWTDFMTDAVDKNWRESARERWNMGCVDYADIKQ